MEKVFPKASVTCIDTSGPHLEEAREKAESTDLEVAFYNQDAEELELDGKFDLIWCADLLHIADVNTSKIFENVKTLMNENSVLAVFHGNWVNQKILPQDKALEMRLGAARIEKFELQGNESFEDTLGYLPSQLEEVFLRRFSILERPEQAKTFEHMENVLEAYSSVEKRANLSESEQSRLNEILDKGFRSYVETCSQYQYSISPFVYAGRWRK